MKILNFFLFLIPTLLFAQSESEPDYLLRAKEQFKNKQYDKAIEAYKNALTLNPKNPQTYFDLGGVYLIKHDLENFSISLLQSIELNPNNEESYYFIGQGFTAMDEPDEIVKIFEEKNDDNTNWGALCLGISSVYERMGELDESIKYLGKGLRTTKYAHIIYTQMGRLFSQYKGDYMKALEYFNRALEYDPTYPQAYYEIGQIYYDQNNWHKGKEYFEKAIIYDSTYAAAYFNLGACYGNMGDDFLAIKNIKNAAELGLEEAKKFLTNNNIK